MVPDSRRFACALIAILICLGIFIASDAQKRRHDDRIQPGRKPNLTQKLFSSEAVSDECISGEEIECCITDPDVPRPNIGRSPKGIIISDCMPINGEIISRPKVCYPKLAKETRVSGLVEVEVVVDEQGKVNWARAKGGHPLLQAVALRAACKTRMRPMVDCTGHTSKTIGILSYNFKLP